MLASELVLVLVLMLAAVLLAVHVQQLGAIAVGLHVTGSGVVVHLEVELAIHRMSPDAFVEWVGSPGRRDRSRYPRPLLRTRLGRVYCSRAVVARRSAGAHAPL